MDRIYDFSILRELRKREGLNIANVSERSGVSSAVISKLERNQTRAELDTIYKLGRVFGMNASELLALAESRSAQKRDKTEHDSNGFHFQEVKYDNVRCLLGTADAGRRVSRPEIHHGDYEVCWVLEGRLAFYLPHEKHELEAGQSIQFDALQEHSYEAIDNVKILILHIKKEKRF